MPNDQCWDALEKMKYEADGSPKGCDSMQWIHLQDALDKGTVSPMECYSAIDLGYVPEHLKVRESRYVDTL